MPVNLTPNAIVAIYGGDVNAKPLVQVVDIKLIGNTQERYRIQISDSVSTQYAMLATQLNDRVKSGGFKKGSVVQLIEYICNVVQNRKIIIVLNMETIILDCEIIGNPKMFSESDSAAQNSVPNGNLQTPLRAGGNNFSAQNAGNNVSGSRANNGSNASNIRSSFQPSHQRPLTHGVQNRGGNVRSFGPTVQPPANYRNQGTIMKNEAPARIIPISSLNPYQGRWAIKARVTAKGDLRCYNNARGDGRVFSFDLLDSGGGEIRVTCFNAVVDRFYDVINVGRVYLISKGSLKLAKKDYNHLNNEWEIFLEATSTVDPCPEEDASIPRQHFTFRPINEIESAESNTILDVIGIVISVNPSVPILRKNGVETLRRNLNLKDTSGKTIELTLWGDFCNREGQKLQEIVDTGSFPVLAVKAGKVNDFSGKSVGTISSSQLFIDPDFQQAHYLRQWFDHGGKLTASVSISRDVNPGGAKNEIRKTVSQIKGEGLGRSNKADWVTVRGTLTFVKADNFCYTACPLTIGDRQCNKKVTRSGNSRWQCDRCNQDFEECEYRYLLQFQIQDHTGMTWVTAFQESGEEILGCSAKELYAIKYELVDDARFREIMRKNLFSRYNFRLKIKEETYGDEERVKITLVKVEPVDHSHTGRYMIDLITNFHKQ